MAALSRVPIAILAACGAVALPTAAIGEDEIVSARGWAEVDASEAGPCKVQILSNGQIYRIFGNGFRPGETLRVSLVNSAVQKVDGRVPPLEYSIGVRSDGSWKTFYIPYVPRLSEDDRRGGKVSIALASARCDHSLGFDWKRAGIRVR